MIECGCRRRQAPRDSGPRGEPLSRYSPDKSSLLAELDPHALFEGSAD
jgi:hypothetical protein